MSIYYNIVCPNCNSIARVGYVLKDTFESSGGLNACDREPFRYYDNDSYNHRIENQDPSFNGDWSLLFTCHDCGHALSDITYIKAFLGFMQQNEEMGTSDLNKLIVPLKHYCNMCNGYEEILAQCYLTITEEGYLCINEHNNLTFVRVTAEESIRDASYKCKGCDEEIDDGRIPDLCIADYFRRNVEVVDIFEDFWPPQESEEIENRWQILDI